MKQLCDFVSDQQKGVALPVVMVIMVLSAVIVLYLANTSKKEQQISADQYRTEQSLDAAMAGLGWAVDYYNSKGLDALLADGNAGTNKIVDFGPGGDSEEKIWFIGSDTSANTSLSASGDLIVKSRTFFCDSSSAEFLNDPENCTALDLTNKEDYDNVGIVSIGYSDDNTAFRVVTEEVKSLNPFPGGGPTTPMTSHGQIKSGGNFKIINRYYNYNIWVGDTFSFSGAASKSYVFNPKYVLPISIPECTLTITNKYDECYRELLTEADVKTKGNTIPGELPASSGSRGNNFDVVDMDPSLNVLQTFSEIAKDPDDPSINCNVTHKDLFFCEFFPTFVNPRELLLAAEGIGQDFDAADGGCEEVNKSDDPENPLTGIIYLKGDCKLNKVVLGTFDDPAIIFIDGNVEFAGGQSTLTTNIFGLLYVAGRITITGSITIKGSSLAEEGVCVPDNTGSCNNIGPGGPGGGKGDGTFIFDPFSANPTNGFNGLRASVPNTWRDWSSN